MTYSDDALAAGLLALVSRLADHQSGRRHVHLHHDPVPPPWPTRPIKEADAVTWDERAACRGMDPEWFLMPDGTRSGAISPHVQKHLDRARTVCARCEVQAECLAEVSSFGRFVDVSIRAGLTPSQRSRGRSRMPQPIRHGTPNGARVHRDRDERPCAACLAAAAEYKRARKARAS